MSIYVARIDREGKALLERAEVTVEVGLPKRAELTIAFADGRHGRASVHHVHPAPSKEQPRLVEIAGIGALE